ncbi:HAMP domain-containing sensor histidine kinase [Spirillospora sp. NPDC049024]
MTLRTRLLIAIVVLTAGALVVAGATSTLALRSYLVGRVDGQLRAAAIVARQNAVVRYGSRDELRTAVAPTEYVVEIRRENGAISGIGGPPELAPGVLSERAPPAPAAGTSAPADVDAGRAGRFRVVSFTTPNGRATAVIGLPLRPVGETVRRLLLIEALAGLAVLALLAGAARLVIRRGLRPLETITETAGAIADGDLDRRVPVSSPRTEAGRLSIAVNGMLARIQTAIEARARSEERLREFVADASHELRTPLTSVRGYLQMLRHGVVTLADRPDAVRRADDEAARMSKIVDDLLYLARLDQEPIPRPGPVDLAAVAADSVSDALAVEPDRPITLRAPESCEIVGDEDALRQVLANLLGNARAHTPPGTPVTVRVLAEAGTAVVEVSDEGPGMPPEAVARAFDRFYRGAGARGGASGSGLGLPIVAAIARSHGGSAGIESTRGKGTTVRVRLPSHGPLNDLSSS